MSEPTAAPYPPPPTQDEIWPAWRPVPINAPAAGLVLVGGDCLLGGWVIVESTGAAAASVNLRDGADAGGIMIAPIRLNAGQTSDGQVPYPGVLCKGGLFLDVVAGLVLGAVWVCDV